VQIVAYNSDIFQHYQMVMQQKLSSVGGPCMFVNTCTSHLSFEIVAVRLSLTLVCIYPLALLISYCQDPLVFLYDLSDSPTTFDVSCVQVIKQVWRE
jgi:hypothetical protein